MSTESASTDRVLELAEEFVARHRAGERPRVEEYARRHPDLADEIRRVFPAVAMMERIAPDGSSPGDPAPSRPPAGMPGVLGDFRIIREVGRGGMGVVYEAEQVSLGRFVALKVLSERMSSHPLHRQRFEREARAAARLHHTNIVPVFGVGEHASVPYYAMQYIPGQGLDAVIAELRAAADPAEERPAPDPFASLVARGLQSGVFAPPTEVDPVAPAETEAGAARAGDTAVSLTSGRAPFWRSVARVGVQVAGALEYAHRQGVLHRDIKPANLLLDAHGTAWVTDFGLAKADGQPDLTHTGDIIGTLRYMPPEAFDGRFDARSDVYALGLTLYELLTHRPAYDERDRNKLVRQVTDGATPRLRTRLPDAPRDLMTIVEKAMENEPARRYQTAAALADDLQRFLDGRPIAARPATELRRAWLWARRRPAIAILAAALLLCLVAGSVVSTAFAVRATRRESDAVAAEEVARQARAAAARQTAELLLDRGTDSARGGDPALALHLFARALRTLPEDDSASAPLERAIRMNLTAWAETVPALEHVFPGGPDGGDAAFSPTGEVIACRVAAGEVQCFRTDTGAPVGQPLKHPAPPFRLERFHGFLAFTPDGNGLWVATAGPRAPAPDSWAVYLFDIQTGRAVRVIESNKPVGRLAVTPDGRHVAGFVFAPAPQSPSNQPGFRPSKVVAVVVWDAAGRELKRAELTTRSWMGGVGISADGKTVSANFKPAAMDGHNFVSLAADGSGAPAFATLPIGDATFRPDQRAGLRRDEHGRIYRWSADWTTDPGVGHPLDLPADRVHSHDGRLLIDPEGRRVLDTGRLPPRPTGARLEQPGTKSIFELYEAFSPDDRFVAGGVFQSGKEKWLWRLPRPRSRPPAPPRRPQARPAHAKFDPSRERLVVRRGTFPESDVRVVDVATGASHGLAVPHGLEVFDVAFDHDGRHFATASRDGTARVWDAATGRPAGPVLKHRNFASSAAFHPDGKTLLVGDYARWVIVWDWRAGAALRGLRHDDIVVGLRVSPDGRHLAAVKAGDWSGREELWLWDLGSDEVLRKLPFERWGDGRDCVEFRPDGGAVCGVDRLGVLRLWEVPSGNLLGASPFDGRRATRFSRDGRVLAAAESRGVRLLDGRDLTPLPGGLLPHDAEVQQLAFSPDGAFLLAGCDDGSAHLWDVATRKPVGPPAVLVGSNAGVAFTADGRTCLCVAPDGTVRRWPVPVPLDEPDMGRLADRVALTTGQRLDENSGLEFVPAAEWRRLRAELVGAGSTALVPPMSDAEWHDARAADAEQDGDAHGAVWHLDRLAVLRPGDPTVPARRGRVLATGRP